MQPFEYANPTTVQEAVGQLGSQWGEADVLAGGTDLISLMKEYLVTPKRLVNIKNIKELGGIQDSKSGLRIGATVSIDELLESAVVHKSFPSLTEAARGVASPQIRNMGTVGGDLTQARQRVSDCAVERLDLAAGGHRPGAIDDPDEVHRSTCKPGTRACTAGRLVLDRHNRRRRGDRGNQDVHRRRRKTERRLRVA